MLSGREPGSYAGNEGGCGPGILLDFTRVTVGFRSRPLAVALFAHDLATLGARSGRCW